MKLTVSVILTALLAFTIGLFNLPWYMYAITTFVIFVAIPQDAGKSFVIGFLTVAVLFILIAAKADFANEHLLSKKVAAIFKLKENFWILLLLTGIVNGLVAGFAALSGSLFRKIFAKRKREY